MAKKKGKEKLGCHEEASWQRNLTDKTGSGCSSAVVIKNWTDAERWGGPGGRSPVSQTGLVALVPCSGTCAGEPPLLQAHGVPPGAALTKPSGDN